MSPKSTRYNPNPAPQNETICGEGSLQRSSRSNEVVRVALTQSDWCRKRIRYRHTQTAGRVRTQEETAVCTPGERPQEEPTLLTLRSRTSSLQNREEIYLPVGVPCLWHAVTQPGLTSTASNRPCGAALGRLTDSHRPLRLSVFSTELRPPHPGASLQPQPRCHHRLSHPHPRVLQEGTSQHKRLSTSFGSTFPSHPDSDDFSPPVCPHHAPVSPTPTLVPCRAISLSS